MYARPAISSAFFQTAVVTALTAAIPCATTLAQPIDMSKLRAVEPNIGDVGPLSTSSRLLPLDTRLPTNFDRVYRIPGSSKGVATFNSAPGQEDKLVRISGGISAVFSRSDYFRTRKGKLATAIPPGTVFHIGRIPDSVLGIAPEPARPVSILSASLATDTRMLEQAVSSRAESMQIETSPVSFRPERTKLRDRSSPVPTVLSDDSFRVNRIKAILLAAARPTE